MIGKNIKLPGRFSDTESPTLKIITNINGNKKIPKIFRFA